VLTFFELSPVFISVMLAQQGMFRRNVRGNLAQKIQSCALVQTAVDLYRSAGFGDRRYALRGDTVESVTILRASVSRAVALVAVLIIIGSVALQDTNAVTEAFRTAVERAGEVCALLVGIPLVWRLLILLVSLDSDKPRIWQRQNNSAPPS